MIRALGTVMLLLGAVLGQASDGFQSERAIPATPLLAKLAAEEHLSDSLMSEIEKAPPARETLDALIRAFEQRLSAEDQQSREDKQRLAVTLIRIGAKDDRWYELLERYAREAVESTTPSSQVYDAAGKEIRGQMAPEFLAWCEDHGKDPNEMLRFSTYGHMQDMKHLGEAGDQRAADLLKRGLASKNVSVVYGSIWGAALLGVESTLSLVVKAIAGEASAAVRLHLAPMLAFYGSPEADAVMERFLGDQRAVESAKRWAVLERSHVQETRERWAAFLRASQ